MLIAQCERNGCKGRRRERERAKIVLILLELELLLLHTVFADGDDNDRVTRVDVSLASTRHDVLDEVETVLDRQVAEVARVRLERNLNTHKKAAAKVTIAEADADVEDGLVATLPPPHTRLTMASRAPHCLSHRSALSLLVHTWLSRMDVMSALPLPVTP